MRILKVFTTRLWKINLLRADTVSCNIGEATSGEVDVRTVVLLGLCADILLEIVANSSLLVPGSLEEVAEATG